jgi:hypothetical protein
MSEALDIRFFESMEPDSPSLSISVQSALNCIPRKKGYQSMPSLLSYTNPMSTRCLGAASFKNETGGSHTYAGDVGSGSGTGNLYRLIDQTWTDSSRATGYSDAAKKWEFAQSGQFVVGTNFMDWPQKITMGGTIFADLTTDFKAKSVAKVRNFLMFGNLEDAVDGTKSSRVRWSAFDNIDSYTVDPATQSDFQDLETAGGEVRKVIGGEYAMIFCERSIWRANYTGDAAVFQIDEIDPGIGTVAQGSVVQHGSNIYFWAEDGFRVTNGGPSVRIGAEQVNRQVQKDLDASNIDRIQGAVDIRSGIVYWAFPSDGNSDGGPNRVVVYNPTTDKFAFAEDTVDILFQAATPSTSLEGLDALYATLEDIPGSLDDAVWAGGAFQLAAINSAFEGCFYTGTARGATIITGETQFFMGRQTFIAGIRPLVDGGSMLIRLGTRRNLDDPVAWTDFSAKEVDGMHGFRSSSRYIRFEIQISGEFTEGIGLIPYGGEAGGR